ncbi:MAG: TauD/TfdA family dioxygenase [Rhodospirillales bacterium]|nr:TauD/TfdA family dioxygenase [Rhodospirillales bacterium]MBO6785817.1 TauD/TfdA family dioxygenase [Rhodospirillales bacterium]
MTIKDFETHAAWRAGDLQNDRSWEFNIDDKARAEMAAAVKKAFDPERPLLDYRREDFDLGPAWHTIAAAIREAYHGRGIALVHGLPREGISEQQFELMNWAIGLHSGVARPQGKMSQYISPVRDAGTNYRAANGRGYSSNAKLDFHTDGCDFVTLACYNKAKSGGQSMISSSVTAFLTMLDETPELAEVAHHTSYGFSRQQEEAPDEATFYLQPLVDFADGRLFGKWNRNRVNSAQNLDEVPKLTGLQIEAMEKLDAVLRRPEHMYTMYLQPGDLQILNNHTMLHSRTDYIDYDEPEKKRLLSRLWMAPPDSVQLPDSWGHFFRATAPGTVRGGIRGHHHDETCRAFERRQAQAHGMTIADPWDERQIA